jgi:uncharacterized protein
MKCRPGCAACCIAPSITSPMPGLPQGKPAGEKCPHLDSELRCRLFESRDRPAVCSSLRPSPEMCGPDARHAMAYLVGLEHATRPR